MPTLKELWRKLSSSKDYRKEYVATLLKRGTAMQIQSLMKLKGWTQTQLAEHSGLTQGVISRARNPEYGNLTFNTVIDIAAGFDVAFIGRFVPFSDFARYVNNMPRELSFAMHSFEEDKEPIDESVLLAAARNVIPMKAFLDKPKGATNDFDFSSIPAAEKKPKSESDSLSRAQEGGLGNEADNNRFIQSAGLR